MSASVSTPSPADPTVSVVMAAYNGARFLAETIASLTAQTMPDFEIVVVDDRSTDDTLPVLAAIPEPRLRVVAAPANGGPAVARTLAMAHARGRFVAGLDQDDLCQPDRFARQLAYLAAHPDVVLVASGAEAFGDGPAARDRHAGLTDPDLIDWRLMIQNPFVWSSVMMRGDAARALVPFERDAVRCAEDFDLYHRIRAFGRLGRIDAPLVRYRHHADGLSKSAETRMLASAAEVLAGRYREAFGDDADHAARSVTRYLSGHTPLPDAATLIEVGALLGRLVAAFGRAAPTRVAADADAIWWRMARLGLRAGRYGVIDLVRARRSLTIDGGATPGLSVVPDATIGAGRRLARRAG